MWMDKETPIAEDSTWKYSFQYSGSQTNCRYLSVNHAGVIASGSRDGSVRTIFDNSLSDTPAFKEGECYSDTMSNVSIPVHSVVSYTVSNDVSVIIAGYRDGTIKFYMHNQKTPFMRHFHHSAAVCSLHIDNETGNLVSGGWDHNAFVYEFISTESTLMWEKKYDLRGHTMSVWDGRSLYGEKNKQITGSADKSVKLWLDGQCIKTFLGYPDVVRAAIVINDDYIIATGNEPVIMVWHKDTTDRPVKEITTLSKSHINTMEIGQNPFNKVTYCAVAGEEGFFQFFRFVDAPFELPCFDLKSVMDGRLPVECIWKLAFMPPGAFTGDIILGSESGVFFVYTLSDTRMAPTEIANKFLIDSVEFAEVQDALKSKHVNNEYFTFKIEPEAGRGQFELKHKIDTDPRVTVRDFLNKNNMSPTYYSEILEFLCKNCADAANYIKRESAPKIDDKDDIKRVKVLHEGKEYDYCFDVSIGDKTVKLPYNVGEDPAEVSSNFCERNKLSVSSLQTFTDFLYSQVPELKNSIPKYSGINFNRTDRITASRPQNCGLPINDLIFFQDFEGDNILKMVTRLKGADEKYKNTENFISESEYEIITNFFITREGSKLLHNNGEILRKLLSRNGDDLLPVFHLIYLTLNFEDVALYLNTKQHIIERYKRLLDDPLTSPNFITMVFRGLSNSCKYKSFLNVYQSEKMFFVNSAFHYATSSKSITQIAALSFLLNFITSSRGNEFQMKEVLIALLNKFSNAQKCSSLFPQGIELILKIWGNMLYDRVDLIQASLNNNGMNLIKILKDRSGEGDSALYARTIFNILQKSQ
uniref:Phospholipase A-2-activating protein n=1 Tax=Parastrongyloides trichosuri TaxID=131310 RepID=A0A0N4ZY82_PARTI